MHPVSPGILKTHLRLDHIDKLPTLPVVALRLLEVTEDELRSPRDVAALIETDPSLAGKTLKMANSAFYGNPAKVSSIRDAVVLVGFNAIRSTVLTLSVGALLKERPSRTGLDREAFWLHCLACASFCRQLCKQSRRWSSRSEEAFLCGLLHDLGKILFDQYLPQEYAKVIHQASSRRTGLAEAEAEMLGTDHAAVGGELLRLWRIPEHLADAVAQHHRVHSGGMGPEPAVGLAAIVQFSDAVIRGAGLGHGGGAAPAHIDPAGMKALGLKPRDVDRLASEVSDTVWDVAALFDICKPAGDSRRPMWEPSPAAAARLRTWEEMEQRYRDLFETSREAIFLLSDLILDCNPQACQLLACEREDIVDGPFEQFLPPAQPDGTPSAETLQAKTTAALEGTAQTFPIQLRLRNGTALETEVRLKAISVRGGPVLQMRVHDIRRRKRVHQAWTRIHKQLKEAQADRRRGEETLQGIHADLERQVRERTSELERAYEELKKLDTMKTAFLSLVSHELRTPLTSIRSFSEILLHYDEDPDTRNEFLQIIHTESERLTRLINDVLDISRIEAGKMVYHDEPLALGRIIQEVARVQQQLLEEKSLHLILDVLPDLPTVVADPDRIQQVITNLLGNAIKFSHPGKEITIRAEHQEGRRRGDPATWVKVSVTDQGIGIDKECLESVFDKFYQVCSDNTLGDKPKGTGLGLPICKEIVTHYHGGIWVESEKDRGSTFNFTLPAG